MKPRSIILILLIVLLPLILLAGASLRLASSEKEALQKRFRELTEDRLRDINGGIRRNFENIEREMQQLTAIDDFDVSQLRQLIRTQPRVLQLFVISEKGQLLYPDPTQTLNGTERNFLLNTAKMFTGQDLRDAVLQQENRSEQNGTLAEPSISRTQDNLPDKQAPQRAPGSLFNAAQGWFVWYWDRGLNLIYWQRRSSGRIVGVALERGRWIADLIAELPDTAVAPNSSGKGNGSGSQQPNPNSLETRIRLTNSSAETVYQWGPFNVSDGVEPFCEIPVAAPLQSWRLQCFIPEEQLNLTGRSAMTGLLGGLIAVAFALLAMAWVLYRDYASGMREAAQQVSFVNQVSHELKTPLTNIRLYAELLETDLASMSPEDAERPMGRLNVILSEGQRLSRLIGNVLTFARQKRQSLQPHRQLLVPDELIQQIVDRFRPALDSLAIRIQLELDAKMAMPIDPDFLEQILGNLISNVEKYAASGKLMRVRSSQAEGVLTLLVEDAGTGIPISKWDEVFRPFSRLSQSVSCAAGTGIGLSIARDLAREHGGDITICQNECDSGCRFRVTMQ
jgi:signal transduction histidine kinase